MRSRPRLDANHIEITEALHRVGASVQSMAALGGGCPDLLVGYRNRNWILEVKTDVGGLTTAQESWLGTWNGQVAIVRNVDGAIRVITERSK